MGSFAYKIIGTSHVSKESKRKIELAVKEFKPDIICVELDRQRLQGLLQKSQGKEENEKIPLKLIFQIGFWGYLFSLLGRTVQNKIGKKLNIMPGEDMLSAVKLAGENNLPLALIDQDIKITLQRLSKNFRFKDKWHFIVDFFRGLIMPKKVLKEMGFTTIDLSKIPSNKIIEKAILMMEKRYPGIYKAIVEDRNHYMVAKIKNILRKEPDKKLLIVVGAGHKKGMEELLKK